MKSKVLMEDLYTCRPGKIWQQLCSEHLGFWFLCIYLFFEYVRPQSIYKSLDIFPWAFASILLALIFSFFDKTEKDKRSGNLVNKFMAGYSAVVLLSCVFAVNSELAFSSLDYFFNWVVVFYVVVRVVVTRQRFFIFFLLYMLVNYKMSQHAFLTWAGRGFSFADWGVVGAPGWFSNSGELGIQLTIFVPLSAAFYYSLRHFWGVGYKIFMVMMPISAAGSIVASSSRGALLGLIAAGVWSVKSSKYFFRGLLLFSLLCAVLFVLTPPEFKERFSNSGNDRTSTHRLDRWASGFDLMQNKPLLGVGHKNWTVYYKRYYSDGSRQSLMIHNIFMESGTEHGFLGLLCLLGLLFGMFRLNMKTREYAKNSGMFFEYNLSYGMSIAIVGMAVSSCFVTVLYYPYVWVHAAFVVALYNSTKNSYKDAEEVFPDNGPIIAR